MSNSPVVKPENTMDLKSVAERLEGSTPSGATIPYNEYKVYGPYKHSDGRKFYHLVRNKRDRKCISVARYTMELHINRYLNERETVDHINNDRTDDRIENLQILTLAENIRKAPRIKVSEAHKREVRKHITRRYRAKRRLLTGRDR